MKKNEKETRMLLAILESQLKIEQAEMNGMKIMKDIYKDDLMAQLVSAKSSKITEINRQIDLLTKELNAYS